MPARGSGQLTGKQIVATGCCFGRPAPLHSMVDVKSAARGVLELSRAEERLTPS